MKEENDQEKKRIPGLDSTGLFKEEDEPVSDDDKHKQIVNLLNEIAATQKDILANIAGEDPDKSD